MVNVVSSNIFYYNRFSRSAASKTSLYDVLYMFLSWSSYQQYIRTLKEHIFPFSSYALAIMYLSIGLQYFITYTYRIRLWR